MTLLSMLAQTELLGTCLGVLGMRTRAKPQDPTPYCKGASRLGFWRESPVLDPPERMIDT